MPRALPLLSSLALLTACKGAPTGAAKIDAPRPVAAAPDALPARRDSPRELHGRITGHDGEPPARATVQLRGLTYSPDEPPVLPVDPDGGFVVPVVPLTGPIVTLQIVAVGHPLLRTAIDLRDPEVALDIRLGGPVEPITAVRAHLVTAIADPDPWSGHASGSLVRGDVLPAVDMRRDASGVFTATVDAAPPGVLYAFARPGVHFKFPDLGPVGRPLPLPPDAEQPSYDGFLEWAFAPAQDGRVALRLDPSKLPPPGVTPVITALGDAPGTAALVRARAVADTWGSSAAYGLPPADAATCARAAADARAPADAEGVTRWMYYVDFATHRGCKISADDARVALERIDPADPLWTLRPEALAATAEVVRQRPADRVQADRYEDAAIERHPDASLVGDLLVARLQAAQSDQGRAQALYDQLAGARFKGTIAAMSLSALDPNRLDVGRPVPDFSVPSADGGPPISRESLLGVPYMLEFWGTWCGPCVEALPEMHAQYARANGARAPKDAAGWRSFTLPRAPAVELVTISVFEPADVVAEFRRTRWPMPWKNGVAGERDAQPLLDAFNVGGIPTAFFVDATGTVVQREGELADGLRKLSRPARGK